MCPSIRSSNHPVIYLFFHLPFQSSIQPSIHALSSLDELLNALKYYSVFMLVINLRPQINLPKIHSNILSSVHPFILLSFNYFIRPPMHHLFHHFVRPYTKERNVLFNDALNTFYLRLYGIRHIVKDHSDSLLFPISSKGSFIGIIPQTG